MNMNILMAVLLVGTTCALSSSPIPPPPSMSMPVWSLACPTIDAAEQKTSMNIMTFCTPISVSPKLWALSLYDNTLTKDSALASKRATLQLLTPSHACLVPILGKQSGRDTDKSQACEEAGFQWRDFCDELLSHKVLPQCPLYIDFRIQSVVADAGDHTLAICEVASIGQWDDDSIKWLGPQDPQLPALDAPDVLYSGWLRDKGIL